MTAARRTLRARLPNGIIVSVKPAGGSASPDAERLAWLLDKPDTREIDLLDFLVTVAATLFPEADPSRRPDLSQGPTDKGFDLMFPLLQSSSVGIVQVKGARFAIQSGNTSKAVAQIKRAIEGTLTKHRVAVAYVIVGRRRSASRLELQQFQEGLPVPLRLWSWDDVAQKLSGAEPDDPEPVFEVVLVEVVRLSRNLLRALVSKPQLLSGIDDRKFEELVATLLFDLGLEDVELTPARQDGGRDIIATHYDRSTGDRVVFLVECKHWVSGNKVTLRWALSLLNVAKQHGATGAVLLSSSGFGPRLLEQEAELAKDTLLLRDQGDLHRWLKTWERQYGSVLLQPIDPRLIFARDEPD